MNTVDAGELCTEVYDAWQEQVATAKVWPRIRGQLAGFDGWSAGGSRTDSARWRCATSTLAQLRMLPCGLTVNRTVNGKE
jgi:hypothetical protein